MIILLRLAGAISNSLHFIGEEERKNNWIFHFFLAAILLQFPRRFSRLFILSMRNRTRGEREKKIRHGR
jgi:hypothetical protein